VATFQFVETSRVESHENAVRGIAAAAGAMQLD
jgi:hypothetical protein